MRVVPVSSCGVRATPTSPSLAKALARPVSVNVNVDDDDSDDSDLDSVASSSSVYCSVASSSSATLKALSERRPRRRGCSRVWYAYPRLCFALVLLGTAFGTGAYTAYFLALRVLDVAGVPDALAVSRTQLVATEIAMRRAATCALNEIPSWAALIRSQLDHGLAPWKRKLDAFESRLETAQHNLTQCAVVEINRLERLVASNVSTLNRTSDDLKCVLDAVEHTIVRYATIASPVPSTFWEAALRRVERIVKTARAQIVLGNLVATRKSDKENVLALAANASSGILSVVDEWMDELDKAVKDDAESSGVASIRLPPLSEMAGFETLAGLMQRGDGPLPLVSRAQLVGALRSIAGVSRDVSHAVDVFAQSFDGIAVFLRSLEERESKVHQELADLQNTTVTHARDSIAQFQAGTARLRAAVASQTHSSIDTLVGGVIDMFDLNHESGLNGVWKQLVAIDDDLVPTGYVLDPKDKPWLEHIELNATFDSLRKVMATQSPDLVEQQGVHRDTKLFRASLYDASAVFVSIILTWDFLVRLGWFLGKLARLLTESYTDLPPVDIRDSVSITTLIDAWGILKCRHDLSSVVLAIMNEGSYVLETAIHFVLWVLLEIAGTLALIAWNHAVSDRCRSKNGHLDATVTTPSTLLIYIQTWLGDSSMVVLSPVAVVTKQTNQVEKALDEDERAWKKKVEDGARTHSIQVDGLMLERQFLLDMRETLASCLVQESEFADVSDSDSDCAFFPVENLEPMASWASDAIDAFRHERLQSTINAEGLVAGCLARNLEQEHTAEPSRLVGQLDHAHSCLLDQTMYLSVASWWMVLVIILALRLTARMVTKSAGMVFWRYLSADRLEVLAFSDENGVIQSRDRLPKAIRRHLRNLRWRVTARMCGVLLGFSSVLVVGLFVFPHHVVQPLE